MSEYKDGRGDYYLAAGKREDWTDPFLEEAYRHGWIILSSVIDRSQAARDACRRYADGEMCDRCDDLIKAFDDAMMRAFWAGTGPFA